MRHKRSLDFPLELLALTAFGPLLRRLGLDPHAGGARSAGSRGCPDILELVTGDFAVIGIDSTSQAASRLPATAGCGPDEAARALDKIEAEFWETKAGLKLQRDRVEKMFAEFIARVPAAALADSGMRRHYKEPEPRKTLHRLASSPKAHRPTPLQATMLSEEATAAVPAVLDRKAAPKDSTPATTPSSPRGFLCRSGSPLAPTPPAPIVGGDVRR